MILSNLTLKPATRRFGAEPRGKYPRLIRQFLNSNEEEMMVEAPAELQTVYLGLRSAVSSMGLKGTVEVRRQDGEVHLIRMG